MLNLKPLAKILLCSHYIPAQLRVLQADAKSTQSSAVDGVQPIAHLDFVISCMHNTVEWHFSQCNSLEMSSCADLCYVSGIG